MALYSRLWAILIPLTSFHRGPEKPTGFNPTGLGRVTACPQVTLPPCTVFSTEEQGPRSHPQSCRPGLTRTKRTHSLNTKCVLVSFTTRLGHSIANVSSNKTSDQATGEKRGAGGGRGELHYRSMSFPLWTDPNYLWVDYQHYWLL